MGFLWSQLFVTPVYPTETFKGKTVIVTGSNTGLGMEAARHFARLDAAKIILAVRNLEAGEKAKASIEASTSTTGVVEVWKLDLGDYNSVQTFATRVQQLPRLDVLLENAGIATSTYRTAEKDESTITVNVVSTFLLAFLLLPKLQATATAYKTTPHLSIVSSEVHAWTKFSERSLPEGQIFPSLSSESTETMSERYPTSKLLEVLVLRQICDNVAQGPNKDVVINYLNPGLCHSELSRESPFFLTVMKFFLARSTEVGSRTLLAAASAGKESHGKYMTDGKSEDDALAPWVRTKEGDEVGEKVWAELKQKLETIAPGVTKSVA